MQKQCIRSKSVDLHYLQKKKGTDPPNSQLERTYCIQACLSFIQHIYIKKT